MAPVPGMAPLRPSASPAGEAREPDDPARIRDAAQQFEALLIGQILRSLRESQGSWMSGAGDCVTDFAEQHLAGVIAAQGGLGLADLIASGLKPRR